jgi:TROVE domain
VSKFNSGATVAPGRGTLATEERPSGKTHEGGAGYARDAKSELFIRATSSFVGEDSFYEGKAVRDDRLRELTASLAVTGDGFAWLQEFVPWLRDGGNMRTAPVIIAAEAVRARLSHKVLTLHEGNRQLIGSALLRADEPGEMLAYWTSRYGRAIPKPVKRGIADACARLYSERSFLRYDSEARGFRFGDVLDLVHASPAPDKAAWQGDLFRWAITARHGRAEAVPETLKTAGARAALGHFSPAARHEIAAEALAGDREKRDLLNRATGGQWEWLHSWLGEKPAEGAVSKADQWRLVLPDLGYMALIRNLKGLDQAGISDEEAAALAARIADPEEVAKSRQFPFRFLSAYLAAPSLRWGHALEKALDASTRNIPEMPGRTLVLIDTSASMDSGMSGKSAMSMARAATLFGLSVAARNPGLADVHGFADGQFRHAGHEYGMSVLKNVEAFTHRIGEVGHGTQIAAAVRATYAGHDRVIIFTDMQTFPDRPYGYSGGYGTGDVSASIPAHIPVYGYNLAGYSHSAMPAGHGNRHELAGLGDSSFAQIVSIERGMAGAWPWNQGAAA